MPAGFNILKMSKSPFGFTFDIGTTAIYKITLKGRNYEWQRVK
jgi:hypothetical protein